MITAAAFDTKLCDREPLQRASADSGTKSPSLQFRLTNDTAPLAIRAQAVRVFGNDQLDQPCLEALVDIARTTVVNLAALAAGKPCVENSLLT